MVLTFLGTLTGGILLALATVDPRQVAWRFFRVVTVISFSLVCLVVVAKFRYPASTGSTAWGIVLSTACAVGTLLAVFTSPFSAHRPRLFRIICALSGVCGLASLSLDWVQASQPASMLMKTLIVTSQVLGALLLGNITVAWLLGHAYLTATRMTIAPLRHFSRVLLWSVAARVIFFSIGLLVAWLANGSGYSDLVKDLAGSWLILTLRVGVGLIAVGVFAYMVADCVRLRATQSATGILYFGSVFAYVGELASQHLTAEYGWPV